MEPRTKYFLAYAKNNRSKRNVIQRRWWRKQRDWLDEIKRALGCKLCSETHPACLDFHHIDPTTKSATIAACKRWWSRERVLEEIAKTELLCANCHRKLHRAKADQEEKE